MWFQELDEDGMREECKPDVILWQLRIRLWELVEIGMLNRAADIPTVTIEDADIHRDICTRPMYLSRIKNKTKGWFICRPLRDFNSQIDALMAIGTNRLWEIMMLPMTKPNGKPDPTAAKMIMSALKLTKEIKYGGLPPRRAPMVPVPLTPSEPPEGEKPEETPVLDQDEEIRVLQDRLKKGVVLDVDAGEVETDDS